MRVLVACEFSGIVREAFRKLGHSAWSCDLLPAEDGSPFHYCGDVMQMLPGGRIYHTMALEGQQTNWDLMIAHPPCTHLAVSGARYFAEKRADGRQQAALDFVRRLLDAPVPKIALENKLNALRV